MALEVGVNSYADVDEADLYFADRLYSDEWLNTDIADKPRALFSAMMVLEPLCEWNGSKTDPDQPLMFPRDGDVTVIDNVKIAQFEIALEILKQGELSSVTEDSLKQIKAGSAALSFYESFKSDTPLINSLVKSMIKNLGVCNFGGGSEIQTVKLVR